MQDFENRPDLSKSVVQVLGTADVQHDLAKISKIIAQHQKFLEAQDLKEKKSRTYPLKKRQVEFWQRVQCLFCEEFAAEVAAHHDPYRLEQCQKKKQAREKKRQLDKDGSKSKKRKLADGSSGKSSDDSEEEEGEVIDSSARVSEVVEKMKFIKNRQL